MGGGSLYHRRLLVHRLYFLRQPGGNYCAGVHEHFFGDRSWKCAAIHRGSDLGCGSGGGNIRLVLPATKASVWLVKPSLVAWLNSPPISSCFDKLSMRSSGSRNPHPE